MIPEPPASCRRENQVLFALSLIPPVGLIGLLAAGYTMAAVMYFWIAFALIGYGTTIPRSRWFCDSVQELPSEQAQKGEVWITIDDGPDPVTTPAVLDLLERYNAKAVFFLIGSKAREHAELVREIARRGHVVGNHSQTHPAGRFWMLRPDQMWREIAGCQETLGEILGQDTRPVWFRPPVGHHNLFISPPLKALGLTMMIWNCRGYDGVDANVDAVLTRIKKSLKPGSIVLLHEANPVCLEIIEGTLQLTKEKGLSLTIPTSRC